MVLGDIIHELLTEDCDLEIDPLKLMNLQSNSKFGHHHEGGIDSMENMIDEATKQKQREHFEKLLMWTDRFLDRITDEKLKEVMPSEVRTVASYIAQVSDSLQLDTPILIGGYIMLRFFNPAIATPDAYSLVKKGKGDHGQRNLILISKIIQNLANGVLFGLKEPHMTLLNDFLKEKIPEMREYLSSVVDLDSTLIVDNDDDDDDNADDGERDHDMNGIAEKKKNKSIFDEKVAQRQFDTIPPKSEYPKMEKYPNQNVLYEPYTIEPVIDFDSLGVSDKDCIKVQKMLWDNAPALVNYLVSKGVKSLRRCGDFMMECVMVLRCLEKSPTSILNAIAAAAAATAATPMTTSNALNAANGGYNSNTLALSLGSTLNEESIREKISETFKSVINALNGCYNEFDNSEFEKRFMVYSPDSTAIKNRTIYFLLNRFDLDIWTVPGHLGCLLLAICKLLFAQKELNSLHLVFDCSLTFIGHQHKTLISNVCDCLVIVISGFLVSVSSDLHFRLTPVLL